MGQPQQVIVQHWLSVQYGGHRLTEKMGALPETDYHSYHPSLTHWHLGPHPQAGQGSEILGQRIGEGL